MVGSRERATRDVHQRTMIGLYRCPADFVSTVSEIHQSDRNVTEINGILDTCYRNKWYHSSLNSYQKTNMHGIRKESMDK